MSIRILVTGGTGFIGSNLVLELTKRGHKVFVSDLMNYAGQGLDYTRCDVSNYRQLESLFAKIGTVDYVYHLAAEYGRWNGEAYYENLWNTNVIGTKHLIRLQEKLGFKMIFFSSAEVYGDYSGEMKEEVMINNQISDTYQMNDYAISKWVGELMIMNSARRFNTETVRVRPVNCYGPHEEYHEYRGFIPKFIYNVLHDHPIIVYKGHKRIIDYVDDSIRTWANIIDNFVAGEVYNVGGKGEWEKDILWYAETIIDIIGKDPNLIEIHEMEPETTIKKSMNFEKAVTDLNHDPNTPPEEGLRKTIEWMKKRYQIK